MFFGYLIAIMNIKRTISLIFVVSLLAILAFVASRKSSRNNEAVVTAEAVTAPNFKPPKAAVPTHEGTVKRRTSFFELMKECGVTPGETYSLERSTKKVYDFRRIYPGQRYEIFLDGKGHVAKLKFTINEDYYLTVKKDSTGFIAEKKHFPYRTTIKKASGIITKSLFASLEKEQVPIEVGLRLADIFAWDIDFFTDIRKNDYFRVIYEEKVRSDGLTKTGRIIAAEFNSKGKSHYAFLFENEDGIADYYDENGHSLRKSLLRAPLKYTRISSSFSYRRYHPILHHYAPHLGVDYAAPIGTPVKATGDGVVITASRRRGNGKYIKIRHNGNLITYYLHLSRFARGIRRGVKVRQGQIIAYVGMTGYATGPHLDYRIKKNGRFVNPRTIKLPPARPVRKEKMQAFASLRDREMAELGNIEIADWRTKLFVSESNGLPNAYTSDELPRPVSAVQ